MVDRKQIERDSFYSDTPFGRKYFTNLVATLKIDNEILAKKNVDLADASKSISKTSKNYPHVIVVSAHYDSKYFVCISFQLKVFDCK